MISVLASPDLSWVLLHTFFRAERRACRCQLCPCTPRHSSDMQCLSLAMGSSVPRGCTVQQWQGPDHACFLLQDTAVILGREQRRLQEDVEVARRQVAQASHVLQVAFLCTAVLSLHTGCHDVHYY